MLDGDAQKENAAAVSELARESGARIVGVTIPSGRDPANYSREALANLVRGEAVRQGVNLPGLT